ncbi:hypothetical protein DB30_07794 [Enhygromyxa salina]|uniref:Uncharacterized protein n=1 Tax=Enhygromyxa salina TaxID=215803 RepID=A0A0C1ZMW3_9BACT|nr:hypothetical protein DB30_07794 [Enhygromyxa salina]
MMRVRELVPSELGEPRLSVDLERAVIDKFRLALERSDQFIGDGVRGIDAHESGP